MATKADSKSCQISEMKLFCKLLPATEANSESCQTFMMDLLCFYILNIHKQTKLTSFFNPSLSSQMSLTVISFDNSDVAGGEQRGRLATNNDCLKLN